MSAARGLDEGIRPGTASRWDESEARFPLLGAVAVERVAGETPP